MIEIGRICLKIAGRDAGLKCVVVEILDDNFVVIDGHTRRKRCNIRHLEPLDQKIDIKEKADHKTVVSEFKKLGIDIRERKSKEQKPRPKKQKKVKKTKAEKPAGKKKEEKQLKEEKQDSKKKKTETKEKPKKDNLL